MKWMVTYEMYFAEKLLPNLHPQSLIVNNASYHSRNKEQLPTVLEKGHNMTVT